MNRHTFALALVGVLMSSLLASRAAAQTLYSQNFDADDTVNWTVNTSSQTDEHADFFFDYSTVGIPPAPNSTGGSTRGMRLSANTDNAPNAGATGGVNVSPIGRSFTGNYALRFDLWSNFIGDAEVADALRYGGSGSSQFSAYGILSKGIGGADPAGGNYMQGTTPAGSGTNVSVDEALWFANSGDGQTSFDYRVHGPGRSGGFRATVETAYNTTTDAGVNYGDVYPANWPSGTLAGTPHPSAGKTNRGVSDDADTATAGVQPDGFLYIDAFPAVPITTSAPQQAVLYPGSQFGSTMEGALGMAWREVEIKKVGDLVTWSVLNAANGPVVLATVDLAGLNPTTAAALTGTNIMFGHSDPSANTGSDPNWAALMFTLIDNVRVEQLAAPVDADFNNDSDVDNGDLATWIGTFGGAATGTTGDANGDNKADGADFLLWQQQYTGPAAAGAVPEPAALSLAAGAALGALIGRRRRGR